MANVDVVVAADVLVAALSRVSPQTVAFPRMPPKTASSAADVIGTFVAPQDFFSLILSEEILDETATALVQTRGALGWDFQRADDAITVLCDLADESSGGLVVPHPTVHTPLAGEAGTAALRTAASDDLGHPRVAAVVTNDANALELPRWCPSGIGWRSEDVMIMAPAKFRDTVERTRRRLRLT